MLLDYTRNCLGSSINSSYGTDFQSICIVQQTPLPMRSRLTPCNHLVECILEKQPFQAVAHVTGR
jgi:hypothetical protein